MTSIIRKVDTRGAIIREAIKRGVNELSSIYLVCGANTPEEKHRVRASIEDLHRKGEIVNASRAVWVYAKIN